MVLQLFAILLFFSSCVEGIVGGVGVGTVFFSKTDYTIFSSKNVSSVQKIINHEMEENEQYGHNIKIIQDKDIIYVIGSVNSIKMKEKIIAILNEGFQKKYINEVTVSNQVRTSMADLGLKIKIKQKLLFAKYISSSNYKVYVYNQKAFIIGQAKSEEEHQNVNTILSKIEYIDDIIAYIVTV